MELKRIISSVVLRSPRAAAPLATTFLATSLPLFDRACLPLQGTEQHESASGAGLPQKLVRCLGAVARRLISPGVRHARELRLLPTPEGAGFPAGPVNLVPLECCLASDSSLAIFERTNSVMARQDSRTVPWSVHVSVCAPRPLSGGSFSDLTSLRGFSG